MATLHFKPLSAQWHVTLQSNIIGERERTNLSFTACVVDARYKLSTGEAIDGVVGAIELYPDSDFVEFDRPFRGTGVLQFSSAGILGTLTVPTSFLTQALVSRKLFDTLISVTSHSHLPALIVVGFKESPGLPQSTSEAFDVRYSRTFPLDSVRVTVPLVTAIQAPNLS